MDTIRLHQIGEPASEWRSPAATSGGLSLIDKVSTDRTLQLAWEKVLSNAGACGVDGITVGRFGKDSQNRRIAVKEQLNKSTYQPKP